MSIRAGSVFPVAIGSIVLFIFILPPVFGHEGDLPESNQSFFKEFDIISYYGSPYTKKMGILGDYPPEKLATLIKEQADEYDKLNGERGVKTAFHIVFASAQPNGELLLVNPTIVKKYIQVAANNNMLVFLDHQIGRHPVAKAAADLLAYAAYDNVHFAVDPEWRTINTGREIGSIDGTEINRIQELIGEHLDKQGILGQKILLVHQFSYKMLTSRPAIKADYPRVKLVHTMDGFGHPALKKDTFAANAKATNLAMKGFKLFYNHRGSWSYDLPLMSPAEVLSLKPRPVVIIYQ